MVLSQRNKPSKIILLLAVLLALVAILLLYLNTIPFSYIWIMDQGKNLNEDYVIKMCPDGTRLAIIQFGSTDAIGVDPNTGIIWTTELKDKGNVNRDQVVRIDPYGNILNRYPGYRTYVFAVDPNDGSVWVGLGNENMVVKLDPEGEPILEVVGFQAPRSIAVNPIDSSVWIADNGRNDQLVHLSSEGVELFKTPTDGFFSASPHQVTVDPRSGNVWYSGSFIESVFLRSAEGELLAEINGFDSPVAISVNPKDSSAWVADYSRDLSGAVVKLDSNGNVLRKEVLENPPRSIAVNPFDETVWVGIEGAVVILSPEGESVENIPGFKLPHSFAFVEIPNTLLAKVDFLRTCMFGTQADQPTRYLKDTAVPPAITSFVVTASPVPTYTPSKTPLPTNTLVHTPTLKITATQGKILEFAPTPTDPPTFVLNQLLGGEKLEIISQLAYASYVNDQLDIFLISDSDPDPEPFIQSLEDDIYPVWSPDGKSLAYLRADSYADIHNIRISDLYLVQNLVQTNLTPDQDLSITELVWSPNGRHLAFSASVQEPSPSTDWSQDIFLADIFTQKIERIIDGKGVGCNQVNWSQDNWELAFACRGGMSSILVIADREGSILWHTNYFPVDLVEWLPSGDMIVIYDEFLELSSIEAKSIQRQDDKANFRYGNLDQQLRGLGVQEKFLEAMGWNPKDDNLFYIQSEDLIQIVDLNLGEVVSILGDFKNLEGQFTWGPDGEQAAFSFFDGTDVEIGIVNFRSKIFYKLTNNQVDDLMPSWKPLP